MKKLSFFLMAMLVSLTSFAAALGDGYEKVTNISNLTTGDRVVVYADAISKGVTGWNGSKDATVAESGWVEYLVEVASGGVYLKDETANNQYIASPGNSNLFKYGTKAVCSVDANGVLKCNNRLLCQNGTYYRMYTSVGSYKPFYVYKVIADAGGDETEDLGDALKWSATSATVQIGADDNEYPTLTNDKNVDVTYSSESEAVATIDANGVVTLVKEGTTTISALYEGGEIDGVTYSAKNVSYTLTVKPAPLVIEPIEGGIIDILTHKTLAATSSSYANFTGKQAANENHSDAVYAGRSARNGNSTQYSIQLNTIDKGRIATTTSGGIAKRVYVKWSTQATLNTNARALNIYGSNDAFTGSETANPSTKIGTITFTTGAAEAYVDFEGDYKYILITGSGAIYMDEIQVTWVVAEGTVTTPTISGADEFIESTEVTISAEDGLKVYYTLDGTDPTNASTEYTAPFELTATTTVKAVAYDGEKASDIISKTFKQLQVLTCEEAAELCAATESADKYVIRGYVTNIAYAYDAGYNNISFWMADTKNGGKVFEAYRAQPVAAADKAVKVGDYVEVIGKIVLYNTTPETSAGGTYTIIPAPVVNHTITVSANPTEAGTVTGGGEFEETDEITVKAVANEGYEFVNWTSGETVVSTENPYKFTVTADLALVANFKKAAPATETIYFVNALNWTGTINAYAWTTDPNAAWPGAAATKEAEQIAGYDVYSYTAEVGKYANVIFNGTGGQTADLVWTAGKYYVLDGWYTKEEAEAKLATPIVDEVVYFVNNKKWSKVNAYAWDPANAAWPGAAATKEAEQIGGFDVYSYSAAPGTYQKVIFNDGGSNQTSDMVWTAGKYIVNNQWYTKEEAEAALAAPVVTTWTMVGDKALFGTDWDLNNTANDLVKQEDGSWVLTLTNKTLAAKSYEYKAAKDRSWNTTVPGGNNAKLTISKAGQYDVTFTLNAAATSVTAKATYIPAKYNVTVTAENGTATGAGEYEEGAEATLTATAAEGYEFVNWTSGETVVSTENPYTFTVTADVALVANFKEAEPEIEWMEMPLEINNLTTEVMEVAGAKYLMMMGGNEEMGESVTLFLNNYADVDDDYEVNAESSLIVYMGYEFTVMEGTISQTSETDKGTLYTGTIYAYTEIEGETMYAAFTLTMYATPVTVLVLTDAIVAINEELGTLTFNIPTGEGEGYFVELSGYTVPGVHEGPQICLFETPEVVAFTNYAETSVADGVITLKGEFTSFMGAKFDLTISGTLPVEEPIEMVGVVKRAVQLGESTVVLTHEANGTPHIYNIVGEELTELSQEGVIARDPENAGDLLAISDIAVTEDGKLIATNYMITQSDDTRVDAGYKRGETRIYIWNDLAGDPSILFTSKMSSNWFRSKQGLTMAVKGTSDNMEIFTTGIHATSAWARVSSYRVIDGVYVEPEVNHNDHYYFYDVNDAIALETTVGTQYELNASPLGDMNWILDAELINPTEIVESASNNVEIATSVALNVDLGKKYNGTTYLTIDEQAIMVAPYATAEGLLAGVKVLDITAGLASATEVAVADLDAAVEATAAATAVVVDEDKLIITLVGDATLYTLTAELTQDPGPGTALENIAVEGKAVKAIINGQLIIIKNGVQYNAQGQVIK